MLPPGAWGPYIVSISGTVSGMECLLRYQSILVSMSYSHPTHGVADYDRLVDFQVVQQA
jgi:hypothetical protein